MLQTIRERLTGWVAIVILGLIALTLVLTFGAIDTGFSAAGSAATVNGEDISMTDFRRLYQRQRQEWEQNYRAQIPDTLAESMADDVVQNLVRNRAIAQYVRDQGYRANQAEVIAAIESTPAFMVGGRFSLPSYRSLLRQEGLSEARYEFEQRQGIEINQFIEGIALSAFYTPAEFRRYVELDGESRSLEYIILSSADQKDQVEITDEAIVAYYEENSNAFMTKESVSLEYVEVSYPDILAATTITVAEAEEYFTENPQEFLGPDEREASHILIVDGDDEAAAEELVNELKSRLDAGESFTELAAEYSADTGSAANGGSLGWLGSGDAPAPEFEEALFAMAEGGISGPVRTQFGWHLIRLDGLRTGGGKEFVDVQDGLIQQLRETAAADAFADLVDELDDRSLESLDGLAPVAESMDLELQTVAEFTRGGGEPFEFSADLISTVFSLEVLEDGDNSPVIDLGEGRAVVVRVTEYRPSTAKAFDDVKAGIINQLVNEESVRLVAAAGDGVVDKLNSGTQRSDLGVTTTWISAEDKRRGDGDLAPDLIAEAFRVAKPVDDAPIYHGLLLASGDFAVFTVTDIQVGTPANYAQEERDIRKQQLAGRLGGAQVTALLENLVSESSVSVNSDLLGTETALP
ncbi:MAG: SurA N-terminal domain-containing protein [Gammaproteobacteria bacterium]